MIDDKMINSESGQTDLSAMGPLENLSLKEKLICQLRELGVSDNGRKIRCDKGKKRGPNSKPRSDKGQRHVNAPLQREPLTIYLVMKNKLLKQEVESSEKGVRVDVNGIFIPIVRENTTRNGEYTYVHRGVKVNRTVKHIAGRTIDLEKYRFEALQSIAGNRELTMKEKLGFYYEVDVTQAETTLELFTRLYHIKEEDYLRWSYDHWRHDYEIVGGQPLETLTFDIMHSPGTPEFMPEYADRVNELNECRRIELRGTQAYRDERAIYRDRLIGKHTAELTTHIVNDPVFATLSLRHIESIVRKALPMEQINYAVESHMNEWLENKIKETY